MSATLFNTMISYNYALQGGKQEINKDNCYLSDKSKPFTKERTLERMLKKEKRSFLWMSAYGLWDQGVVTP